jgi:hypothetical protein
MAFIAHVSNHEEHIIITWNVILYGLKFDFLNLRGNIFRDFENKVLRRKFGLKKGEMARDWSELYDEEFQNITSIGVIRIVWHVEFAEDMKNL